MGTASNDQEASVRAFAASLAANDEAARWRLLETFAVALGFESGQALRLRPPAEPLPPLDEDIATKTNGRQKYQPAPIYELAAVLANIYYDEGEKAPVRICAASKFRRAFERNANPRLAWGNALLMANTYNELNALLKAILQETRDPALLAAIRAL